VVCDVVGSATVDKVGDFVPAQPRRSAFTVDDEIQFHLEQQIGENIAAGMNREEARYAAMRDFGNPMVVPRQN
jgi:hypothetical protein